MRLLRRFFQPETREFGFFRLYLLDLSFFLKDRAVNPYLGDIAIIASRFFYRSLIIFSVYEEFYDEHILPYFKIAVQVAGHVRLCGR
jgi:hypothetical protein